MKIKHDIRAVGFGPQTRMFYGEVEISRIVQSYTNSLDGMVIYGVVIGQAGEVLADKRFELCLPTGGDPCLEIGTYTGEGVSNFACETRLDGPAAIKTFTRMAERSNRRGNGKEQEQIATV
jgi:hypothetical protein